MHVFSAINRNILRALSMIPLLLGLMTIVCYIWYKLSIRRFEKCGLPSHRTYTVFGDTLRVLKMKTYEPKEALKALMDLTEKFKEERIMGCWGGPFYLVFLWEPSFLKVIASNPATTRKGTLLTTAFMDMSCDGVWSHEGGPKWKELRKPFNKTMSIQLLNNNYHRVFLKRNKDFVEYLKESNCGKELHVLHEISRLNSDIFGETHLGVITNDAREKKYSFIEESNKLVEDRVKYIATVNYFFLRMILRLPFPDSPEKKKIRQFLNLVVQERRKIITSHLAEGGSELYTDFLIKKGDAEKKDVTHIFRQIHDVAIAGAETSAVTLASSLVFLAMLPELQEQVYQEQVGILGEDISKEPTPQDLDKMELLIRVIKETLRHICPVAITKEAEDDIKLGNYNIPKGAIFFAFIARLHHDPQFWQRPDDFYPDHFLPEQVSGRPSYAYIPFGIGPRQCAGIRYGWSSMLTAGSYLIRNFKLSSKYNYEDIVYEYSIMRQFTNEYYNITFTKRQT